MFHALVILLFLAFYLRDALPAMGNGVSLPWWQVTMFAVGAPLALGSVVAGVYARAVRLMDSTGSIASVRAADQLASVARQIAVCVHIIAVVWLGWGDLVHEALGGVIVIDVVIAMSPTLGMFVWVWWAQAFVDRRFREASVIRSLDEGRPLPSLPSPARLAWLQARHHLLIVLIPLLMIRAWSEGVAWLLSTSYGQGVVSALEGRLGNAALVVDLATLPGVLLVLIAMPLVVRWTWQTGPMPERLEADIRAMAGRHRVRLGGLYAWDTSSTLVNGLIVGPFWPFRQMMLSDALIERLPEHETLAVAAHEVAHVRHRHLVLLLLGVMAALLLLAACFSGMGVLVAQLWPDGSWMGRGVRNLIELVGVGVSLPVVFVIFVLLSRRFEWQADAFAAGEMSRLIAREDRARSTIQHDDDRHAANEERSQGSSRREADRQQEQASTMTTAGVLSMVNALGRVATLNGVTVSRSSLRHGSIGLRQRKLLKLRGAPIGRTPIDRLVRWIKAGIVLGFISGLWLTVWQAMP